MDFETQKTYQLALNFIKGLGPSTYVNLIEEFGSAEAIFNLKEEELKPFISGKKVLKS